MNRNRKLRKQMMSGLAVGMAAVMGAAPVYAAAGEDAAVSKEENRICKCKCRRIGRSDYRIQLAEERRNGKEPEKDESELKDIKT